MILLSCTIAASSTYGAITDAYSEDIARFTRMLGSSIPERRIEGIQRLSHLKHWPSECAIWEFVNDKSAAVRREAITAIGRIGTADSIPWLLEVLEPAASRSQRANVPWDVREHAFLALRRMTGETLSDSGPAWREWWAKSSPLEIEQRLLAVAAGKTTNSVAGERRGALRALRHMATTASEPVLLELLESKANPPLTVDERSFIAEALERIGSAKAIPALSRFHHESSAWALGRIGGPEAERALLGFPKSLPVLLNLDRVGSTNVSQFLAHLINNFGLVTYRGQPDDLHLPEAQPIQRVGANLIRRSGLAANVIEAVVRELEQTMAPPIHSPPAGTLIPELAPLLTKMREELKPGFVRGDGMTTSQPLTALYHVADDRTLAPRLIPLLRHPAFVPRIYVAMLLGKLGATEAYPEIRAIIREGYSFSDSTALASGKHFEQSQTVRWRGFLCMALGRMKYDQARIELESLACDPSQPRDIRYGAVIGLQFFGSPDSISALRRVAADDVIWTVRDAAELAVGEIEMILEENAKDVSVEHQRTARRGRSETVQSPNFESRNPK